MRLRVCGVKVYCYAPLNFVQFSAFVELHAMFATDVNIVCCLRTHVGDPLRAAKSLSLLLECIFRGVIRLLANLPPSTRVIFTISQWPTITSHSRQQPVSAVEQKIVDQSKLSNYKILYKNSVL